MNRRVLSSIHRTTSTTCGPSRTRHNYSSTTRTNDLRNRDKTPEQIVDDLLDIGHTAQSLGVETVVFSSLVIRRDGVPMDRKRKAVNRMLRERCAIEHFKFTDNENICFDDIDEADLIHFLEGGSIKLANNILNVLNSLH